MKIYGNRIKIWISIIILLGFLVPLLPARAAGAGYTNLTISDNNSQVTESTVSISNSNVMSEKAMVRSSAPVSSQMLYSKHLATQNDITKMASRLGVYDPNMNYNKIIDGHGTGLSPPTKDSLLSMVGKVNIFEDTKARSLGSLPSSVDHSTELYFPAVGNQGTMGSCAAWSTAYYTNGYLQAKDNGWTQTYAGTNKSQLMSPTWTYNKVNRGVDNGSSTWGNADLIATVGAATMNTMDYNESDIHDWGDEAAWREAPLYRISSTYDLTYGYDTMVIKSWLAEGYVLPMALDDNNLYTGLGYYDDTISSSEYNEVQYNHANTIVGYDDSKIADGDVGAFKIVNSWGKSWGSEWGGNGYYYMTYDALAKLSYPIIRMYDRIGYEPNLLAVWKQSTVGSKDSFIAVGTDSGNSTFRIPSWDAGDSNFPSFMALDITELNDDVGISNFFLYVGSGSNDSIISYFEIERYLNGYTPGKPSDLSGPSKDTPKTAPAYVYTSFNNIQININTPANGTLLNGNIDISGIADDNVKRTIFKEDFEGPFTPDFIGDSNTKSGLDYWNLSTVKSNNGDRSAWVAGSDRGIVFSEDFNHDGSTPSGWATYSEGPDYYPFFFTNTGYLGSGGSDYVAVANSDHGYSTDINEWLYTTTPFSPHNHKNLSLRFYLDYSTYFYDEYAQVLYATDSTYPTFYNLATYTSDTLGYEQIDISSLDDQTSIYLAFRYHGTNDWYMVVDDVLVTGDKTTYDNDMNAYMDWSIGNISKFDSVNLTYNYWLDSENNADYLYMEYYQFPKGWSATDSNTGKSNGWSKSTVSVPTDATYFGFLFVSDSKNVYEGAYIDDAELIGYVDRDNVEVSIDNGTWSDATNMSNWHYIWNSALYPDGEHLITARADYNGLFSYSSIKLNIDNTPPILSDGWNDPVTTGDVTNLYTTATDLHGVGSIAALYSFDNGTEINSTITTLVNGSWKIGLNVPDNAKEFKYRFWATDSLGNSIFSVQHTIPVVDNDKPTFGPDRTSKTATTGDNLTFSMNATDNIGVDKICLEYWYGSGAHQNISIIGGQFNKTIIVDDTLENLSYFFSSVDTSNNWARSLNKSITITDNDKPIFDLDETPTTTTTGDGFGFAIIARDNIALENVSVEYWFGTGPHTVLQMNGTFLYSCNITIPDTLENMSYIFTATDTSNNINNTDEKMVAIIDNDPPRLKEDKSPSSADTGSKYTFSASATDNIGVQKIEIEYWFGSGQHNLSTLDSNGELIIDIPENSLDALSYKIKITDTSGNNISTDIKMVTINDSIAPIIGKDLSDISATTGDDFNFSVEASDNIGLKTVEVEYWFGSGEHKIAQMTGSPFNYEIELPPDFVGTLNYKFTAIDDAGNMIKGDAVKRIVKDNDSPIIYNDLTPKIIKQGDMLIFNVTASDNIGITQMHVIYRLGNQKEIDMEMDVEGNNFTKAVEIKNIGTLYYRFVAMDAAGNTAKTQDTIVTIKPTGGTNVAGMGYLPFIVLFGILIVVIIGTVAMRRKKSVQKVSPKDSSRRIQPQATLQIPRKEPEAAPKAQPRIPAQTSQSIKSIPPVPPISKVQKTISSPPKIQAPEPLEPKMQASIQNISKMQAPIRSTIKTQEAVSPSPNSQVNSIQIGPSVPTTTFCGNCGNRLNMEGKFCPSCGAPRQ